MDVCNSSIVLFFPPSVTNNRIRSKEKERRYCSLFYMALAWGVLGLEFVVPARNEERGTKPMRAYRKLPNKQAKQKKKNQCINNRSGAFVMTCDFSDVTMFVFDVVLDCLVELLCC